MSQSSVAVIGASSDRRKYGNKAVRAYLSTGFKVFPVNLRGESIEGLPSYKSLAEIPEKVDFVSLYVTPAVGIQMLSAIADMEPQEVWLNPGSESDDLIEAAADLKLRVIVACSIQALGINPSELSDK